MAVITALRTERLVVPLPTPIMSGLGPITTTGVLLVFLDTDQGVIGENFVFTLNNRRLAVLDEMVRSLEPLVVGLDPQFSTRFWSEAWRDINFVGHTGRAGDGDLGDRWGALGCPGEAGRVADPSADRGAAEQRAGVCERRAVAFVEHRRAAAGGAGVRRAGVPGGEDAAGQADGAGGRGAGQGGARGGGARGWR